MTTSSEAQNEETPQHHIDVFEEQKQEENEVRGNLEITSDDSQS
jgi:hypothetical protein